MKDLKALYEGLGFSKVTTYIQSGNVIFKSDSLAPSALSHNIKEAIKQRYSFDVPVLIRTQQEIEQVMQHPSFSTLNLESEGSQYLVTFLENDAKEEDIALLQDSLKEDESLEVIGREIYLHTPSGYGKTKISNTFIEKKLQQNATTRNYKTIIKLYFLTK